MSIPQQHYTAICKALLASDHNVTLLAVSKTHPAAAVAELHALGQRHFGENQVPEALQKMQQLQSLDDLQWHFIGPIQRNKTRAIAEHFDWVQSLDRKLIADRLAAQRPASSPALNVLVQVNVDAEPQKAGCAVAQVPELAAHIATQPNLRLRGLMAIPANSDDPQARRQSFLRLQQCYTECRQRGLDMDTLSMGMSDDWALALECGSNMVRIGSALFGSRD
ncbi:MAG: YggS family pyridoxal phosphate-dependent enzyme [Gammaproteobacteria bacterium]|jgi:pyridoxal phosphate enzyme (YggS family)|nr:YggS family pyridoxal phosphate-dependent enzyme [Gammaproteobacteria bacterium]